MCALPVPPKVKRNNVTNSLYTITNIFLKIVQVVVMLYVTWILVDVVLTFGPYCVLYETSRKASEIYYDKRDLFLGKPDIGCSLFGLPCLVVNVCSMEPRMYATPFVDSTQYTPIIVVVIVQTCLAPYKICKTLICTYLLCFAWHVLSVRNDYVLHLLPEEIYGEFKMVDATLISCLTLLHFFILK